MQDSVRASPETAQPGAQPQFVIIQPGLVARTRTGYYDQR